MMKRSAEGWWSAPLRDDEALCRVMMKRSAEWWWSAPPRDDEVLRQGMMKRSAEGWWSTPPRDDEVLHSAQVVAWLELVVSFIATFDHGIQTQQMYWVIGMLRRQWPYILSTMLLFWLFSLIFSSIVVLICVLWRCKMTEKKGLSALLLLPVCSVYTVHQHRK